MFSINSCSTNSDLLRSINKTILDSNKSGGYFSEFRSFSLGYDESSTKYPYLIVAPISEIIKRIYTSGFADVDRKYTFIIRGIKPTHEGSFGLVNGLANSIKIFFSRRISNPYWKLTSISNGEIIVFNTKVSEITFEEYVNTREGVLSQAKLSITFSGLLFLEELQQNSTDELFQTNLKEITKIIHEIFSKYKLSYLSEVKTLKYGTIEPISHFPGVTIVPEESSSDSRFAGADIYSSNYSIYCLTSFQNNPISIYQNLDIIHKLRNILIANKYIFKRAFDYDLSTINFGELYVGDLNYFSSQIKLSLLSLDSLI